MLPFFRKLDKKIQSLEEYYEGAELLKKEIKPEHILGELRELRRLKWTE
jgi:hypothetical protein